MKRALIFAAALSLLLPAAALSAPDKDRDHHAGMTKPAHGQKPVRPGKPDKPSKPGGGHHHKPGGGNHHKPVKPGKPGRPGKPGKPGKPGVKPPHRPGHKPGWNRPGHKPNRPGYGYHKPRPSQYYWRGKWFGRLHAAAFRYPAGYRYRTWYVGNRLPSLLLTAAYFYDGYATLGLETPPPGYRWVRYGPDLLLVNVDTGDVEDVVYGAFY